MLDTVHLSMGWGYVGCLKEKKRSMRTCCVYKNRKQMEIPDEFRSRWIFTWKFCLTISIVLVRIQGTKLKYTKWKIITKSKKWFTFCS